MKKVLIVASTSGFIKGFLLSDAKMLQELGYEVHCAANHKAMVTFKAEELFPKYNIIFHQVDFPPNRPLSRETLSAARQYLDIINNIDFDLIHCHSPIVGAIVRLLGVKYRKNGGKIIYTTHGLAFSKDSGWKSKLFYGTTEWLCAKLCDKVITINHDDFNMMKKLSPRNTVYINGVGVNTEKFHHVNINRNEYRESLGITAEQKMVLTVGEISKRKNQKVIVKALSKLDNSYVFVICGKVMNDSAIYNELLEIAEQLHVNLKFLGFRSDVPEILKCADVFVLPSLREGLCFAGVEALASGIPVVGSNVKGVKDFIVDGETGYLSDPYDADMFAKKIELASSRGQRKKMESKCIEKAEEFSATVSHGQMSAIYEEVLNIR